jgi:hypothetical protein
MGTGIKSDATAKSEKKANMIIPLMVYFNLCSSSERASKP